MPMVVKTSTRSRRSHAKISANRAQENMASETYKAVVQYAGDDFFIGTGPSGHAQVMDSKGDRLAGPTPVEMLLVSVAACTAMDVQSILEKKRQLVTDYRVEIEGTRAEDHPKRFLTFNVH